MITIHARPIHTDSPTDIQTDIAIAGRLLLTNASRAKSWHSCV